MKQAIAITALFLGIIFESALWDHPIMQSPDELTVSEFEAAEAAALCPGCKSENVIISGGYTERGLVTVECFECEELTEKHIEKGII